MDPGVAVVVLIAATLHALWNAGVKSGRDPLLSLTGINAAAGIMALALVPLTGLPAAQSWPYLLASAALHFGYYITLSEAYRRGDFSATYPVARGVAPVLVTAWGVLVLGEAVTALEGVSLAGVMAGLLIFSLRSFSSVAHDRGALLAALATSVFIAGYTLVDGVGGRLSLNVPGYMVWLFVLDAVPITLYALWRRGGAPVRALTGQWKTWLAGAVLASVSYALVVWCMSLAPIPLVSALRETSIVIAALIGALYFREPAGARRILASLVIFLSVALLALG